MNIATNINNTLAKHLDISYDDYRYINAGGRTVYVEGLKSLASITDIEICFRLSKHMLTIKGTGLRIKELDKTTAIVTGQILHIEVV